MTKLLLLMHTPNVVIFGSCDIVDGHTHEQVYKKGRNEGYEHNKIDGGYMYFFLIANP